MGKLKTWEKFSTYVRDVALARSPYTGKRPPPGTGWSEVVLFGLFAVCAFVLVSFHEPWADEAQAWLIARDSNFFELFSRVRYEGSPGLWHILLWGMAKAGMAYENLNVVSCILGCAASFFLVFKSPFPFYLRALVAFSFFVAYQFTVSGRSYSLALPLIFALATLYGQRGRTPFLYAACIFALASLSVHTFVLAGWLWVFWTLETWGNHKRKTESYFTIGLGVALVALAGLFIPPSDVVIFDLQESRMTSTFGQRLKEAFGFRIFAFFLAPIFSAGTSHFLLDAVMMTWVGMWFHRKGILALFLLPVLSMGLIGALTTQGYWHLGLYQLWIVFCAWISWDALPVRGKITPFVQTAAGLSLVAMFLISVESWVKGAYAEITQTYSGAQASAMAVEKLHSAGQQIHGYGYHAVALLPYFSKNVYANHNQGDPNRSFWIWRRGTGEGAVVDPAIVQRIRMEKPDIAVLALKTPTQLSGAMSHPIAGYELIQLDTGVMPGPNSLHELEAFAIFARADRVTQAKEALLGQPLKRLPTSSPLR